MSAQGSKTVSNALGADVNAPTSEAVVVDSASDRVVKEAVKSGNRVEERILETSDADDRSETDETVYEYALDPEDELEFIPNVEWEFPFLDLPQPLTKQQEKERKSAKRRFEFESKMAAEQQVRWRDREEKKKVEEAEQRKKEMKKAEEGEKKKKEMATKDAVGATSPAEEAEQEPRNANRVAPDSSSDDDGVFEQIPEHGRRPVQKRLEAVRASDLSVGDTSLGLKRQSVAVRLSQKSIPSPDPKRTPRRSESEQEDVNASRDRMDWEDFVRQRDESNYNPDLDTATKVDRTTLKRLLESLNSDQKKDFDNLIVSAKRKFVYVKFGAESTGVYAPRSPTTSEQDKMMIVKKKLAQEQKDVAEAFNNVTEYIEKMLETWPNTTKDQKRALMEHILRIIQVDDVVKQLEKEKDSLSSHVEKLSLKLRRKEENEEKMKHRIAKLEAERDAERAEKEKLLAERKNAQKKAEEDHDTLEHLLVDPVARRDFYKALFVDGDLHFRPNFSAAGFDGQANLRFAVWKKFRPVPIPAGRFQIHEKVHQEKWEQTLRNGRINTELADRMAAIRELVADVRGTQTWRNSGALAFVRNSLLRIHHARRNTVFNGISSLRELLLTELGTDDVFMEFVEIVCHMAFESDISILPQLSDAVLSVTLSHQQIGVFIARMFLGSGPDRNFSSCLTSNNETALQKILFMREYIVRTAKHPMDRQVSYRLVKMSRGEFDAEWRRRSTKLLQEIQVVEKMDVERIRVCSRLIGVNKRVGGSVLCASKGEGEEEREFLQFPQLLLLLLLHPNLMEDEILSVVGCLQFSRCERSGGSFAMLKNFLEAGNSPSDRYHDGHGRAVTEHLLVALKTFPSRKVEDQIDTLMEDVHKLSIAMSCQENGFSEIPVVTGPLGFVGNSDRELMFLKIVMAATFSRRPLLYHSNGDSLHWKQADNLVDRFRYYKRSLEDIKSLIQRAKGSQILKTQGLFKAIHDLMEKDGHVANPVV